MIVSFMVLAVSWANSSKVFEEITEGVDGVNTVFTVTNPEILFPIRVTADLTNDGISNPIPMEIIHDVTESDVEWSMLTVSGSVKVNSDLSRGKNPKISVDSRNTVHAAWIGEDGIYYANDDNGHFAVPKRMRGRESGTIYYVIMEVGPEGNVFLLWLEELVLFYAYGIEGNFSDPDSIGYHLKYEPELLADSQGKGHVLWSDEEGLQYVYIDCEGNFIRSEICSTHSLYPDFVLDTHDKIHVAFSGFVEIEETFGGIHVFYTNNGKGYFEDPLRISEIFYYNRHPLIRIDHEGCVRIVWIVYDDEYSLQYVDNCLETFSDPEEITRHTKKGYDMQIDLNGAVWILFSTKDGVFYASDHIGHFDEIRSLSGQGACNDRVQALVDSHNRIYAFWIQWEQYSSGTLLYAVKTENEFAQPVPLAAGVNTNYFCCGQNRMRTKTGVIWCSDEMDSNYFDIYVSTISMHGNEVKFHRDNRTLAFETPPVVGSVITVEGYSEILPPDEVYVYPNPVVDEATIHCYLKEPASVTISIFDVSFELVRRIKESGVGECEFTWDVRDVASGVYPYRFEATGSDGNTECVEAKLMIVK